MPYDTTPRPCSKYLGSRTESGRRTVCGLGGGQISVQRRRRYPEPVGNLGDGDIGIGEQRPRDVEIVLGQLWRSASCSPRSLWRRAGLRPRRSGRSRTATECNVSARRRAKSTCGLFPDRARPGHASFLGTAMRMIPDVIMRKKHGRGGMRKADFRTRLLQRKSAARSTRNSRFREFLRGRNQE
jgi:hypothetical protein